MDGHHHTPLCLSLNMLCLYDLSTSLLSFSLKVLNIFQVYGNITGDKLLLML